MKNVFGIVSHVIYFNEENGFGVVRLKLDYSDSRLASVKQIIISNTLTVTTNFDRKPLVNEEYSFIGDFVNTNYGLQFKATSFTRSQRKSLESVVAYLSSDFFPGVGKVTAERIYNTLGSDCLNKIIKDRDVLKTVPRLSKKQREVIYETLIDKTQNEQVLLKLLDYGFTMNFALRIVKKLGAKAIDIVEENPYQLIDFIEGFGFIRADKVALKMGIAPDSDIRVQAIINYYVRQLTFSNGDTYIEKDYLIKNVMETLSKEGEAVSHEKFLENLTKLHRDKKIVIKNDNQIYNKDVYKSEVSLAKRIVEILSNESLLSYQQEDIEKVFQTVAQRSQIEFSPKQTEAIKTALNENLTIITGGPGTGKSTIIKAIIESLILLEENEHFKETIALVAPTGRAAKRLSEVTNHPAMTIHRLLGYEGGSRFKHGPENLIHQSVLIVDEASMIDIMLTARLFASLPKNAKIILVGDYDQLSSVGPGQVLYDLITSREITTVRLDMIHRQAENSSIVHLAHCVNDGSIPADIYEKKHDRNFLKMNDESILNNIVATVKRALATGMDLVRDVQVLVPMYKGELGINNINARLQQELNPLQSDEEIVHLGRHFRTYDKVIQLVNRNEKGVMNGDIGYILNLVYENGKYIGLDVMYDFGSVYYKVEELDDLTHAYAISIHKSQGSEFDLVIIPFTFKYYIMLKRKLVYTAITRAKKYLIMLGNGEALARSVIGIEQLRKSSLIEHIYEYMDPVTKVENALDEFETSEDDSLANISPYDFL